MASRAPTGFRLWKDFINDYKHDLDKLDNLKNTVVRTDFFMDTKLTNLKLKRARLEARLAYSRTQFLIAEMQLHVADKELQHQLTRRRRSINLSAARCRVRRSCRIMKPLHKGTKTAYPKLDTCKDAKIVQINTKDISTQVDMDDRHGKNFKTAEERVEGRKSHNRIKKKWSSERDLKRDDRRESRRVAADEVKLADTARAANSCNGTPENTNPRKKRKTDDDNDRRSDKGGNDRKRRDYRERHRERRGQKHRAREEICRFEKNTHWVTLNNARQDSNDNGKMKDNTEIKECAVKKNEETSFANRVTKPLKSILKNPIPKEIISNVNANDKDQERKISNSSDEIDWTRNIANKILEMKEEFIEDVNENVPEESGHKNTEETSRAEPPTYIPDINIKKENIEADHSNTDPNNSDNYTVVLQIIDDNLVQQLHEMCEEPTSLQSVKTENFEYGKPNKLERSPSMETLILQDCCNFSNEDL